MKVMMVPHALNIVGHNPSGIQTLINKYFEHLPAYGVELVDPHASSFDVLAVHAGMSKDYSGDVPLVAHLHGLYWTADYPADHWEYKVNRDVIDGIRHATLVTTPSRWVAETFQRDMHMMPVVLPHGIDVVDWLHDEDNEGYVLWNKNRVGDVCDPSPIGELAKRFPAEQFLTTFAPPAATANIKTIGLQPHEQMRPIVQRAGVYLATTKETFGIGILEAMASRVPVLGFNHGGICDIVEHGVNGYLARPGDYDDLAEGLNFCLKYRETLGYNGLQLVQRFDWKSAAQQIREAYDHTLQVFNLPPTVGVVIPCYNYADKLARCVESVMRQTHTPQNVLIVDNNSTDHTKAEAERLAQLYPGIVHYTNEERQGVAHARNHGVLLLANCKYICCIDADDAIEPAFLKTCVDALERDSTIHIAYTRLRWIKPDGTTGVSIWPDNYNFDDFLKRKNQVPTCSVYRRDLWARLAGYRQRFAPMGAGAEDAEFYLRAGALGYRAQLVTEEALFVYSWQSGHTSKPGYVEADWLAGKPWVDDGQHPFASHATPKRLSHPVRQYDEPLISVVIPCSEAHRAHLIDVLDSLEAQTFRKWEVIVIFDGCTPDFDILEGFPFVRWHTHARARGAGAARNTGAKMARAKLLLFVDADDWLRPTALARLLNAWNDTKSIVYSDYAGHATIEAAHEVQKLRMRGVLESYNEKTKQAVVLHQSLDFDCARAQRQPEVNGGQFYIWNLISSLVPKVWHDEIGGFDESMQSWEDWEYWLRMARSGKCFVRLTEVLVDYRFDTGTRRETGRQIYQSLLEYITKKFEGIALMPCGSCGGRRARQPVSIPSHHPSAQSASPLQMMSADQIVLVELIDGNYGDHNLGRGLVTQTDYGYRKHGDRFRMHIADAQARPHMFQVVIETSDTAPTQVEEPVEVIAPLAEPVKIADNGSPVRRKKQRIEQPS